MPDQDETYLSRKEAADYLQRRRCHISYATLGNMAAGNNSGGGPPFYKDGGRALYTPTDLDQWRRGRLRRVE